MEIKILLAEDDVNLGFVVADHLKSEGFKVTLCNDGQDALKRFNEEKFHLCILDVMMPKKDGFTLAKDLRKLNLDIPILFLTAKSQLEDKAEGYKSGGDDYLTKPFSVEELSFRIKALLKRVQITVEKPEEKILTIGNTVFDSENLTLTFKNQKQSLTKKEAQILKLMFKLKNQVIPREVILNGVWGQDDYFVGRSLDVFITKLRKYLKEDETIQISNLHGIGFKFTVKE
ncbi:MAG: response regulator transcription factor [Bacteroidetes bacterium]|nr:response regulator transcription factor [Bacteroidota bacterium]